MLQVQRPFKAYCLAQIIWAGLTISNLFDIYHLKSGWKWQQPTRDKTGIPEQLMVLLTETYNLPSSTRWKIGSLCQPHLPTDLFNLLLLFSAHCNTSPQQVVAPHLSGFVYVCFPMRSCGRDHVWAQLESAEKLSQSAEANLFKINSVTVISWITVCSWMHK